MRFQKTFATLACLFVSSVLANNLSAEDWLEFRKDNSRSGYVSTQVDASRLSVAWEWNSPVPPDPAWDGPARNDVVEMASSRLEYASD